ncbi:MAG: hypothetical protein A2255_09605 [Candidatus Melainabacteria bacterium RIFOXYA2_FULL_32_9]|nr:MAG: hypothetical protein A2255_09605 [Candidatus Melainabacteria bacterium RIFOXYA2_FULL_32_9]
MHTKESLKEKLEKNNRSLTEETIEKYLRSWRIDPLYEDENGIEFFDDLAIAKLNQGIILKEQGCSDNEILSVINKEMKTSTSNPINAPSVRKTIPQPQESLKRTELESITVDLTSQTLMVLAESIAQKITTDIADKIKDGDIIQPAMDFGKLRRDNEILAKQVEKLIEENKKLSTRVNLLLQEKAKFKQAFGSFYIKQG